MKPLDANGSPRRAARSLSGRDLLAIGLDIGGTKIAGGVVSEDGRVVHQATVPTPTGGQQEATLAAIDDLVKDLHSRFPSVKAIGVGAAGVVEWPEGCIRFAPNNAYRDLRLRARLEESTGLRTIVDNDANMAAWGEARFGAGSDAEQIVLVTVGTGIGGGLIVNGGLLRGRNGLGGEVGHLVVDADGEPCGCGNRGCLEAMASGSALGRCGRQAAAAEPGGLLAELARGGSVTGEIVFTAALQGDHAALALFARIGFWLGVGVASLVNIFDPDVVIVGGGLAQTGDLLLRPTRAALDRFLFARDYRRAPDIVVAGLGRQAGLIGAATLAMVSR